MDGNQRANQQLDFRGLFGGWNQIGRRSQQRPNLHVHQFGRRLGKHRRAEQRLDFRRLFGGWQPVGGSGRKQCSSRADLPLANGADIESGAFREQAVVFVANILERRRVDAEPGFNHYKLDCGDKLTHHGERRNADSDITAQRQQFLQAHLSLEVICFSRDERERLIWYPESGQGACPHLLPGIAIQSIHCVGAGRPSSGPADMPRRRRNAAGHPTQ